MISSNEIRCKTPAKRHKKASVTCREGPLQPSGRKNECSNTRPRPITQMETSCQKCAQAKSRE